MIRGLESVQVLAIQERSGYQREDWGDLEGLALSIIESGLVQPLVVKSLGIVSGKYEIIAGHRRYRACCLLELPEIQCIVISGSSADSDLLNLIENIQRVNLHPLDVSTILAIALASSGGTRISLAKSVGLSESVVNQLLRFQELVPRAGQAYRAGILGTRQARSIARLTAEDQNKIKDFSKLPPGEVLEVAARKSTLTRGRVIKKLRKPEIVELRAILSLDLNEAALNIVRRTIAELHDLGFKPAFYTTAPTHGGEVTHV